MSHFNRHIWPWHCQPRLLIIQTNVKKICNHTHRGLLKVVLTFVIKNQDQECLGLNMQLCSVMYDQKPRLIVLWSNIPALCRVTQHTHDTGVENCIHLLIVWDSLILAIEICKFQVNFPLARDLKTRYIQFQISVYNIYSTLAISNLAIDQTFFTGLSY